MSPAQGFRRRRAWGSPARWAPPTPRGRCSSWGVEQVTGALGPGTYAARGVFSSLSCADYPSGCTWGADDWGYWNVQPGGDGGWNSPLCTLTVQELSSAARAGMRASFDCSAIEPAWYDGPPAPSPIAVSGTFDLPPASAAGAPADAGGDAGVGGEPGHCTVVAEGEYPAAAATGGGGAIGSSEFCDVQAGGIAYAIGLDDALAPSVSLVGSTWCASGCSIVYVAGVDGVPDDSECSLEVIEDEGVGGRYVATFACDRLTAGDGPPCGSEDDRRRPPGRAHSAVRAPRASPRVGSRNGVGVPGGGRYTSRTRAERGARASPPSPHPWFVPGDLPERENATRTDCLRSQRDDGRGRCGFVYERGVVARAGGPRRRSRCRTRRLPRRDDGDVGRRESRDGGIVPSTASTNDAAPAGDAGVGPVPATGALTGLHVDAGHLVNGSGEIVWLRGADHSYTEDTCPTGGFSDGHLVQADLDVMKSFGLNAVRVPLNEDCWLGINGVTTGGSTYQADVASYVNLITSNGLAVILDLHWSAPGAQLANQGQMSMADADHAPAFWTGVASAFASKGASDTTSNGMVLFDLFNEPYLTDWTCWLQGGCSVTNQSGATYTGTNGSTGLAAGMATLLQTVRATGAQNVVMIGGIGYAHNLSSTWISLVQSIPQVNGTPITNVAASFHWNVLSYFGDESPADWSCYNSFDAGSCTYPTPAQAAPIWNLPSVIAAGFPIVFGETYLDAWAPPQEGAFYDAFPGWMDQQQQSYVAWSWNTDTPPVLLSSWSYGATPTMTFNGATFPSYLTYSGYVFTNHVSSVH